MRIEEIDKRLDDDANYWSKQAPLTYRVSIKIENDEIILKREYFYVGFTDGEDFDDFYFDSDWHDYFTRGTFITRNLNEQYLIDKEKELIQKFYENLEICIKNCKKELKESIRDINKKISNYEECKKDQLFVKVVRKKKLNNIK